MVVGQITSDFTDELEQHFDAAKRKVKQEPKKFLASAKAQILGTQQAQTNPAPQVQNEIQKIEKANGKQANNGKGAIDPVTGLPVPPKPMVTVLQQELKQLDNAKKMRVKQELEVELEKQRMKNTGEGVESTIPGVGPVMPKDKKKLDPDSVQRMKQNAKSTGELRSGDLVG